MTCQGFRKYLSIATVSLCTLPDGEKKFDEWIEHQNSCRVCGALYMELGLKKDGVPASRVLAYPCIHIAYYAEREDRSLTVDRQNIGITIPEGQGGGYLRIHFCPWCGKNLRSFRGLKKENRRRPR